MLLGTRMETEGVPLCRELARMPLPPINRRFCIASIEMKIWLGSAVETVMHRDMPS